VFPVFGCCADLLVSFVFFVVEISPRMVSPISASPLVKRLTELL